MQLISARLAEQTGGQRQLAAAELASIGAALAAGPAPPPAGAGLAREFSEAAAQAAFGGGGHGPAVHRGGAVLGAGGAVDDFVIISMANAGYVPPPPGHTAGPSVRVVV